MTEWSNHVEGSVWFYAPIKTASVVFAILFFLSGLVHAYQVKYDDITLRLPGFKLLLTITADTTNYGVFVLSSLGPRF